MEKRRRTGTRVWVMHSDRVCRKILRKAEASELTYRLPESFTVWNINHTWNWFCYSWKMHEGTLHFWNTALVDTRKNLSYKIVTKVDLVPQTSLFVRNLLKLEESSLVRPPRPSSALTSSGRYITRFKFNIKNERARCRNFSVNKAELSLIKLLPRPSKI